MLFDSHCHLNNEKFDEDKVRRLAEEIGKDSLISAVMDVGFDLKSSALAVKHAHTYDWVWAAVGVHPHDTDCMDEDVYRQIKELARDEKAKAIGEIGLDFHYDFSNRKNQIYWFERQIELALEMEMPIVIHSREADGKTLEILEKSGALSSERMKQFPKRQLTDEALSASSGQSGDSRVLLHCYSGSLELAKEYIKLGATLSICGPVTFKNNRKTVEVVEGIPLDFLMVETDSPYLTPVPFRGKENRPNYVRYTAEKVAEIKGMSFEEVALTTAKNTRTFFNID